MRVVHVTPYFAPAFRYGGPPRSVLGLCKGLQGAGVTVEVLTTVANGPTDLPASPPEGDEYDGVPVRYLARGFPWVWFAAPLRKPLAAALSRADLLHVHGIWNVPEWSAAALARRRGAPYVMSPRGMLHAGAQQHGHSLRKRVAYRLIERSRLAGARLLHATSDHEETVLRALALDVPIAVVPNGVDQTAVLAAPAGFRQRLGIPASAFVVLFLGRIHRIKRLDLLAEAFGRARYAHSAMHLVIAGPDEQGLLADVLRKLDLHAGFVHAMDTVADRDKWALLKDANAVVQCSDSESFGMTVAEALAASTPVVVTRTCPWPDIEARGCGFWVEQSAPAIAEALCALVDNPDRARAMGRHGAAWVQERYSWDAVGRRMASHYADILGGGRRADQSWAPPFVADSDRVEADELVATAADTGQ